MLPRPYVGIYSGEKGHKILHEPCILILAKSVELFFMVSISDMPTIKHWQKLVSIMNKAKEKIPKEYRIGDTCFTSFTAVGGNLFTRHLKNLNHVHKDSNNILSVIIILGKKVHGGKPFFNNEKKMNDIGKIAHVLKHSRRRCVFGPFDKIIYEDSILTGYRSVLSFILHKSIFLYFLHNGTRFYDKYISSDKRKKYIDDDRSALFQNRMLEIYTIKNIKRLIQIDIMFLKMTI